MKKILLFVLLVFCMGSGLRLHGQSINKQDRFFLRKMKKAHLAGMQVGYLSNGELAWVGSYGSRNLSTHEPVDDSTLFMIASCSKPVTALALMKLFDEGRIQLDDDINKWLPVKISNPNFPGSLISIRMLLTHTSSLKDDDSLLASLYTHKEGGDSPQSMAEFIQAYFTKGGAYYNAEKNFTRDAPGTKKLYANVGFALCGYLVECISGRSFASYMQAEIFQPLKMFNSCWYLRDLPGQNLASPHDAHLQPIKHYGYPTVADGQMRTNITDYAQVIKLMLNGGQVGDGKFLKKETVDTFLAVQDPGVNKWQAIAWNYNEFDSWIYYLLMPRLPSHTGVDPGVNTVVSFNPDKKYGAIIFANTLTTTLKTQQVFYQVIMKRLLREARRQKKSAIP